MAKKSVHKLATRGWGGEARYLPTQGYGAIRPNRLATRGWGAVAPYLVTQGYGDYGSDYHVHSGTAQRLRLVGYPDPRMPARHG